MTKTMTRPKTRKPHVRVDLKASRGAIARRYAEGESLDAIAADYDIHVATVRNIARDAGIKMRRRGRPSGT